MGIEPTRPAWKAGILPLNYTRIRFQPLYYITLIFICQVVLQKFFKIFQNKNGVAQIRTSPLLYVSKCLNRIYLTTIFIIFPGTTISFIIVFPSIAAFTFSSALTISKTSSLDAEFDIKITERTLPFI